MSERRVDGVLIIDDNDVDSFICQKMIEISDFSTFLVTKKTVKDGLDYLILNQHQVKNLPEVILLDIDMPVDDGFLFMEHYESLSQSTKNKCKIFILSSSINEKEIKSILQNRHIVKFIEKPITQTKLREIKKSISTSELINSGD